MAYSAKVSASRQLAAKKRGLLYDVEYGLYGCPHCEECLYDTMEEAKECDCQEISNVAVTMAEFFPGSKKDVYDGSFFVAPLNTEEVAPLVAEDSCSDVLPELVFGNFDPEDEEESENCSTDATVVVSAASTIETDWVSRFVDLSLVTFHDGTSLMSLVTDLSDDFQVAVGQLEMAGAHYYWDLRYHMLSGLEDQGLVMDDILWKRLCHCDRLALRGKFALAFANLSHYLYLEGLYLWVCGATIEYCGGSISAKTTSLIGRRKQRFVKSFDKFSHCRVSGPKGLECASGFADTVREMRPFSWLTKDNVVIAYNKIKQDILGALKYFVTSLGGFASIFWDTVATIENKVKDFMEEHWVLTLVSSSLMSSFFFFVAILVCVTAFSKLASCLGTGISSVVGIISIVSGIYFGGIGLGKVVDTEWGKSVKGLVNFFRVTSEVIFGYDSDDEDMVQYKSKNAPPTSKMEFGEHGDPLPPRPQASMMESLIGAFSFLGLSRFILKLVPEGVRDKLKGVTILGNLSRDVCNIARGKEAFKTAAQSLLAYIKRVADAVMLKDVGAISVMSLFVNKDFEKWMEEVSLYADETYPSMMMSPLARLYKLRQLEDTRVQFSQYFASQGNKIPGTLAREFALCADMLRNKLQEVSRAKAYDVKRECPFVVALHGPTRTGKSTVVQKMAHRLMDLFDEPKECRMYARKISSQFWNGYCHQPCVIYDDFGALSTQTASDERELFDIVSVTPCPLNMAALEDKKTMFTSKYVFLTTNFKDAVPAAGINNLDAFRSRRHVLLDVRRCEDPTRGYQEFTLLSPTMEGFPYIDVHGTVVEVPIWYTFDEIVDILWEKASAFKQAQATASGVEEYRSFVDGLNNLMLRGASFQSLSAADRIRFVECFHGLSCEGEPLFYDTSICWNTRMLCAPGSEPELLDGTGLDEEEHDRFLDVFGQWSKSLDEVVMLDYLNLCPPENKSLIIQYLQGEVDSLKDMRSLFTPMEFYLLDRLEEAFKGRFVRKPSMFLRFQNTVRNYFAAAIPKLPMYMKFMLSISLFLLCGFGIYKCLVMVMSANTADKIVSLGSALASGIATSVYSSDDGNNERAMRRSKVRYTYNMDKYVASGVSFDSELEKCLHSLGSLVDDSTGFRSNVIFLGGKWVLFTKHVWDFQIKSGRYKLYTNNLATPLFIQKRCAKTLVVPERDLVAVNLGESFPNQEGGFWKLLLDDLNQVPEQVVGHSFTPRVEDGGFFLQACCPKGTRFSGKGQTYVLANRELPMVESYEYSGPFRNGDCNSPFFANVRGKWRLLGLHYYDFNQKHDDVKGGAQIVTTSVLVGVKEAIKGVAMASGLEITPSNCVLPVGTLELLGNLEPSKAPYFAKHTQLKKSVISDVLELPCVTEPAILHNGDPRIATSSNPHFDVFVDGMRKYEKMAGPFNCPDECGKDEHFEDALDEMFDSFSIEDNSLDVVPIEVALNGIPGVEYMDPIVSSTSEGYDYVLSRPPGVSGKSWLLEGAPGCWSLDPSSEVARRKAELEAAYQREEYLPLIGIDCPKDERVAKRKIENPKTRLFTVLPLEYNLLTRQYYLHFVKVLMSKHNDIACKVGINPLGNEWTLLYNNLRAKGENWFNGDFERFDGATPRDVVAGIADRINQKYKNGHLVRKMILLHSGMRFGIAGRKIFRVSSGIPSGFSLTVILNSLVNEFYLRWSWKKLATKELQSAIFFEKSVAFAVYGDDNIVSVVNGSTWFNLKSIAALLKTRGVILKCGSDKTAELAEFYDPASCDFLKRKMVVDTEHQRVMAPLDKISITERLHYIRECDEEVLALQENCMSALQEAMFYGRDYFLVLRGKIFDALRKKGLKFSLPTFADCRRVWLAGPGALDRAMDILCEVQPIQVIKVSSRHTEIVPGVFIASADIKVPAAQSGIWCGTYVHPKYGDDQLVGKMKGGVCAIAVYRSFFRSHVFDRPVCFVSQDGYKLSIIAACFYLLQVRKMNLTFVEELVARLCTNSTDCTTIMMAVKPW